MKTIQIGDWNFEIIQIRARKTKNHGEPYTAISNITITDGVPHVEGLLSINRFLRPDFETFDEYIKQLGYDCVSYNGKIKHRSNLK